MLCIKLFNALVVTTGILQLIESRAFIMNLMEIAPKSE